MDLTHTAFIGIHIAAGRKYGFTYAALNADRQLLALSPGDWQEIASFCAGQSSAFAAISAPPRPNMNMISRNEQQEQLFPLPDRRYKDPMRLSEMLLNGRGMGSYATPADAADCPVWMRMGFDLYRRLEASGYQPYPCEGAPRQYLETPAESAFIALLGLVPFHAATLESRLQRQLVLYEHMLPVKDPLHFLEEVTRHKLLKGILPLENIHTPSELSALALAYTAWLAAQEPPQVELLGDPVEGQIVLPAVEIEARRR